VKNELGVSNEALKAEANGRERGHGAPGEGQSAPPISYGSEGAL